MPESRLTVCSGDKKVLDALELMNAEGVSSLAVVDNQRNVIGNISTTDVKASFARTRDMYLYADLFLVVSHKIQFYPLAKIYVFSFSIGDIGR